MFHFVNPVTQTTDYTIWSESDLQEFKNAIQTDDMGKTCRIKACLEKYDEKLLSELEGLARQVSQKGINAELIIDSSGLDFTVSEMEQFIDLEDRCINDNIGVYCSEGLDQYTLEDTLSAQVQIDGIIDKIKKSGCSPLEQYLMAYDFVSAKVYKENKNNRSRARDLTAILNGDDIVCVGYAELMARICKGLGINCSCQHSKVYNKDGRYLGEHQNNIVYLKDEKYGVDGYYYSDACWDAVEKQGQYKRRLSHCLLPLKDKDKMREREVDELTWVGIDSGDVELEYFYGKEVDRYSIDARSLSMKEENQIFNKVTGILVDDKKRKSACKKFAMMLKKLDIPADAFKSDKGDCFLPSIMNPDYILALLMNPKENASEIDKVIQCFQDVMKSRVDKLEHLDIISIPSIDNIYQHLEDMSNTTSKINDNFRWTPEEWRKVSRQLEKLEARKAVAEKTNQAVKPGKAISVEVYREALVQANIANGQSKGEAEHNAEVTIETTIKHAETWFKEDAENDFKQTAIRRRALENSEAQAMS